VTRFLCYAIIKTKGWREGVIREQKARKKKLLFPQRLRKRRQMDGHCQGLSSQLKLREMSLPSQQPVTVLLLSVGWDGSCSIPSP